MTIRHVLAHVEAGAACARRLGFTISLAESFDAKLTGIGIQPSPKTMASSLMADASVYNVLMQSAEDCFAAAKALFQTATAARTIPTDWRQGAGLPVEIVSAEAGAADLVVLGRDGDVGTDGAFYTVAPADIILRCGRPVLVVPDPPPEQFLCKRVCLAWKSAPASARAAHDALPLLVKAEEVLLTEIVAEQPQPSAKHEIDADAMGDHLRSHGVNVRVRRFAGPADAGALLIASAQEEGCDLIVAGAYGHNRFREWVLGGVTRTLLEYNPLPCLLSH
jgi:nucleotide-binding universal stress UspA family protein